MARLLQLISPRATCDVEKGRVGRFLGEKRTRVLTLTLPCFFVVFICYTSSYNMAWIIWWRVILVNWPLRGILLPDSR
jgi:hypothetical protein